MYKKQQQFNRCVVQEKEENKNVRVAKKRLSVEKNALLVKKGNP